MCCSSSGNPGCSDKCVGRTPLCWSENRVHPMGEAVTDDWGNNNDRQQDNFENQDATTLHQQTDVHSRQPQPHGIKWTWCWCCNVSKQKDVTENRPDYDKISVVDLPETRYMNGGGGSVGKENGVQPKPILHHSTPNLSSKSDPPSTDLKEQPELRRTPPSLPSTAPETQRSPLSSRSDEHLSLKSVSSTNFSAASSNISSAPSNHSLQLRSPSSHALAIEYREDEETNEVVNGSSTESIRVLDSTAPIETTEVNEENEETVQETRPESEAGSESSQEIHASGSRPIISKSLIQSRKKKAFVIGRPEVIAEHKLYPESLPPYTQPKEALAKTLLQLNNPEWEVIMQGLEGLVRLVRHHPKALSASTHQVAIYVTRHVRALRSQVARAACQASQQLFTSLGRGMDSELEELTGALLSRMADTNRFLRADSSLALDTLVDHSGPVKSIQAVVNKGSKHQNAIVRGATCRLLLRICTRLGTVRTMALPKDTRDSVLITGAKCLTEGSLDTRRYAKEMFTLLSSDTRLKNIMSDVVPNNIMRTISKALMRILQN